MTRTIYILFLFLIYIYNANNIYSLDSIYLNQVEIKRSQDSLKIEISFSNIVEYKINKLSPDVEEGTTNRMYIDFSPSILSKDIQSVIEVGDANLYRIRIAQFKEQTSRVVFDINNFLEYEIEQEYKPYKFIISYKADNNLENVGLNTDHNKDENTINDILVSKEQDDLKESDIAVNSSNIVEKQEPFDPDDAPPLAIKVTDKISFGAKLNFKLEGANNQEDLDNNLKDGLLGFTTRLSIAGQFKPNANIKIFSEGSLSNLWVIKDDADKKSSDTEVRLTRAYIKWRDFLKKDHDIQIGRQRIRDDREWIYDENLDAIRIFYDPKPISLEFSVSTVLFENQISLISLEAENTLNDRQKAINYIFYSSYEYDRKERISVFTVIRQDRNGSAEDSFFIGTSWRGRPFFKGTKIWVDDAIFIGRNDENQWVKGFGIDVGITKSFKKSLKPNFTIASAFGSKDFRQTSLEDNTAKFTGTTKFKYYGEVFDPELSNLYIGTLGLGIKPYKKTSLDFVYHYFSQISKKDEIEDTDIDPDPTGDSRDIGHEIDLIFGTSIKKYVRLAIVGGIFFPGDAFEENDPAYFGEIELQFVIR